MSKSKYTLFKTLVLLMLVCACSTNKHSYNSGLEKDAISNAKTKPPTSIDTIKRAPLTSNKEHIEFIHPKTHYLTAFDELKAMLENKQKPSFKRAVFITENAYFENRLNYSIFCEQITALAFISKLWSKANSIKDYNFSDSTDINLNAGIFYTLTDTVFDSRKSIINVPYTYDFNDCFAREMWTNMFVTKLLSTHKGNCHSLPFLYKIIAEELGVNVWLSFTPNHIYLRNWCKKTGWYNTEMTNASFPNEGWLMASGYVSTASIVSGIYMDTLGLKESIVVCLNDLAKGYLRKISRPDLEFVLTCCDLGLMYYPNYAELLLLKAETHLKLFKFYENTYGLNVQNPSEPQSKTVKYHLSEMEKSYALLAQYDYREIPEEMFIEWIQALENNTEKYVDKRINATFKFN